jgi:hypothetical protein
MTDQNKPEPAPLVASVEFIEALDAVGSAFTSRVRGQLPSISNALPMALTKLLRAPRPEPACDLQRWELRKWEQEAKKALASKTRECERAWQARDRACETANKRIAALETQTKTLCGIQDQDRQRIAELKAELEARAPARTLSDVAAEVIYCAREEAPLEPEWMAKMTALLDEYKRLFDAEGE